MRKVDQYQTIVTFIFTDIFTCIQEPIIYNLVNYVQMNFLLIYVRDPKVLQDKGISQVVQCQQIFLEMQSPIGEPPYEVQISNFEKCCFLQLPHIMVFLAARSTSRLGSPVFVVCSRICCFVFSPLQWVGKVFSEGQRSLVLRNVISILSFVQLDIIIQKVKFYT